MSYEHDMEIDDSALDVECLEQGNLALKYGRIWADAKREADAAVENIKVIRSELIKEANEDPEECCGKEKPNAGDIEAYYRNDKRHKAAKQEWLDAAYELDMAGHTKNEICFTRKAMLEALITLHGQQYFAGPKMPRDLSFEAQKRHTQKKTNAGIASKRTRTRSTQS